MVILLIRFVFLKFKIYYNNNNLILNTSLTDEWVNIIKNKTHDSTQNLLSLKELVWV